MSKNLKWLSVGVVVILLVGILCLWGGRGSSDQGTKHIVIKIEGVKTKQETAFDTDCDTLAELLKTKQELQAEMKEGPYGAYLYSLAGEAEDEASGPWWVFSSDNNEDCLAMQMCPAIDQVHLHDQDEFTFSLISDFDE